jgi:DNA-binding response OmpR family regulator
MDKRDTPPASGRANVLACDGLTLDVSRRQVVSHTGPQHLSPTECLLLETFMQHPRQVLSRRFLMKRVWYTDFCDDTRVLEVYVCGLRRKIEVDPARPRYLRTVRGVGYRFGPP